MTMVLHVNYHEIQYSSVLTMVLHVNYHEIHVVKQKKNSGACNL